MDEAGFALLPLVVRTYAPCGQTPGLRAPLIHDHLSVIGAISTDGRLFMQMQRKAYKGPDIIRFLRLLLRKIPGKLLIIWDGASIHRCQALKDFLARGAAKRLHLEQLPGYARRPQSTRGHLERGSSDANSRMCVVVIFGRSKTNSVMPKRAFDIAS